MNFDDYLKYAAANGKGSNPFMYAPEKMAQVLGYGGEAKKFLGMGGSPSESTGEGTEAQYALTPEFETFLRQYDYTPGMQGKNADVAIRDAQGNVVSDKFRTGDHTGSMMKAAGIAIPALVAGGFGAGALGALGMGPMAGAPSGASGSFNAALNNSLNGMSLANTGAASSSAPLFGAGSEAAAGYIAPSAGQFAGMSIPELNAASAALGGAAGGAAGGIGGAAAAASLGSSGLDAMRAGEISGYETDGRMPSSAAIANGIGSAGGLLGAAAGSIPWGDIGKAAIGPLLSSGMQIYGANQASDAMADATNKANELQRYVYDTNRTDNMPALTARNSALEQMQALLKDPSTLTSQPGYAFGLNEGTKSLNSGAAARGMTYSGAQGKALQRYGQDYAGTKLNDSFNRLSALAGSGQVGAGQISQAGQNYGQQVGNNITNQGNANAMPWLVGGAAAGNAINGLTAYGERKGWFQP